MQLQEELNNKVTTSKVRNDNNAKVWPEWADKIIFFQLAAGTRPSAVVENIATDAQAFAKDAVMNELPIMYAQLSKESKNCMRRHCFMPIVKGIRVETSTHR